MKRFGLFLICGLFSLYIGSPAATAQQVDPLIEEFYNGLAAIIEQNMNNPEACVREVGVYYQANQDKVRQIRERAQKAMQMVAPEMENLMSMSEEEIEAYARKMEAQMKARGIKPQSQLSAAGKRYVDAIKEFTAKFPQQAMQIAGLAVQLIPRMQNEGMFERKE